jgi:hypothetical protein
MKEQSSNEVSTRGALCLLAASPAAGTWAARVAVCAAGVQPAVARPAALTLAHHARLHAQIILKLSKEAELEPKDMAGIQLSVRVM